MKDLAGCGRVQDAWKRWLAVTRERCHLHFRLEGDDLETHINVCTTSARQTAARVARDISGCSPNSILEIGCSVGFNCFALAEQFPSAQVVGIEPDLEAVNVAAAMASVREGSRVRVIHGVGETLPFNLETFDLIVCHTVIEHVRNVPHVIAEMARVLSRVGVIHLEAPNYRWPKEPHLGIWCVPLLGKRWMSLSAALQGKHDHLYYLDHLQLVHPAWLEGLFKECGLRWENRMKAKLESISDGKMTDVKAYRGLARALQAFAGMGVNKALISLAMKTGIYPSLLYTIRKSVTCV